MMCTRRWSPFRRNITFEEAVDIACEALKPLGEDYVSALRTGILEERWVDIMENKGKTSGAYSFGVYDSDPYILMNFKGTLKDIFTLVHEGERNAAHPLPAAEYGFPGDAEIPHQFLY